MHDQKTLSMDKHSQQPVTEPTIGAHAHSLTSDTRLMSQPNFLSISSLSLSFSIHLLSLSLLPILLFFCFPYFQSPSNFLLASLYHSPHPHSLTSSPSAFPSNMDSRTDCKTRIHSKWFPNYFLLC
jgi:hypothetical protein